MNENVRIIGLDETGRFIYNETEGFQCIGGLVADVFDSNEADEIKKISEYYDNLCLLYDNKSYVDSIDSEEEEDNKDNKKGYEFYYNKSVEEKGIGYIPDKEKVKAGLDKDWKVFFPESFHGSQTVVYKSLGDSNNRYQKGNIKVELNYKSKEYNGKQEQYDEDKKIHDGFIREFNNYIRKNTVYYVKKINEKANKKFKLWCYIFPNTFDESDIKSNILDLKVGDNLYEEMAITAVENLSFYVVDSDIKKVFLNAATKVDVKSDDDSNVEQYNDLYSKKIQNVEKNSKKSDEDDAKKDIYYITDTSFYRTALRHRYNSLNAGKIDFSINVAKIEYEGSSAAYTKKKDNDKKNSGFPFDLDKIRSQINESKDDSNSQNEGSTLTPAEQWEKTKEEQGFHYASDVICGYFRNNIFKSGDLKKNVIKAFKLKNSDDVDIYDIRFFSEEDKIYRKMLDCIRTYDITGYYSLKYDFSKRLSSTYINSIADRKNSKKTVVKAMGEKLCDYYEEFFVREIDEYIKNNIVNSNDYEYGNKLISSMQEYWSFTDGLMGRRENQYERGMYIAKNIYYNIIIPLDSNNSFRSSQYKKMYIFRFNDIILRGYNHRGDVKEALKHNKICMDNIAAIGMDEFQEFKLRSFQIYFNSMNYEKIIDDYKKIYKLRKKNNSIVLGQIEKIKEIAFDMCDNTHINYLLFGKIYSTLGQTYAYLNNPAALVCFERALKEMEDDKENAEITISYLAHHLISIGDKTGFEKYFKIYVGDNENIDTFSLEGLKKCFDDIYKLIEKNCNNEVRFALYLLLKGIRVFYMNIARKNIPVEEGNTEELMTFAEYMAKKLVDFNLKNEINDEDNKEISGDYIHPYQLIYKNMFDILENIRQTDYLKTQNLIRNRYQKMDAETKKKYNTLVEYEKRLVVCILDRRRFKNGLTIQAILIKFKLCLPHDLLAILISELSEKDKEKIGLTEEIIDNIKKEKYAEVLTDEEKDILMDMNGLSDVKTNIITQEKILSVLEQKLSYMYD